MSVEDLDLDMIQLDAFWAQPNRLQLAADPMLTPAQLGAIIFMLLRPLRPMGDARDDIVYGVEHFSLITTGYPGVHKDHVLDVLNVLAMNPALPYPIAIFLFQFQGCATKIWANPALPMWILEDARFMENDRVLSISAKVCPEVPILKADVFTFQALAAHVALLEEKRMQRQTEMRTRENTDRILPWDTTTCWYFYLATTPYNKIVSLLGGLFLYFEKEGQVLRTDEVSDGEFHALSSMRIEPSMGVGVPTLRWVLAAARYFSDKHWSPEKIYSEAAVLAMLEP